MGSKAKYRGQLLDSGKPITRRILLGVPVTGLVRIEWAMARYGQIIPVNWSFGEFTQWVDQYSPLGYMVADARNLIVDRCVRENWEWLFFIDHDVILPPNTLVKLGEYISEDKHPVVCGWYNAKGNPPEPLLFRGRGNSWYRNWKAGERVWVDGIPMGCTLISGKLLKAMWEESEEYSLGNMRVRRVFHTPRNWGFDPERGWTVATGTEDIWWCDRVMKGGFLKKAGFPEYQKKKYPFLVDTSIKCGHIDWNGRIV